jgi:hypothetical protein
MEARPCFHALLPKLQNTVFLDIGQEKTERRRWKSVKRERWKSIETGGGSSWRPIAMVRMRDALINVLGMVDEDGPLVEDSRSEDEIYDLAGDAPSLRDREVPRCPTSTYGLPGAIVDDKERFIGLLRWLHQAGNGDYAAAIDGLMNQTATAAEDDVPDRGASEPKP